MVLCVVHKCPLINAVFLDLIPGKSMYPVYCLMVPIHGEEGHDKLVRNLLTRTARICTLRAKMYCNSDESQAQVTDCITTCWLLKQAAMRRAVAEDPSLAADHPELQDTLQKVRRRDMADQLPHHCACNEHKGLLFLYRLVLYRKEAGWCRRVFLSRGSGRVDFGQHDV